MERVPLAQDIRPAGPSPAAGQVTPSGIAARVAGASASVILAFPEGPRDLTAFDAASRVRRQSPTDTSPRIGGQGREPTAGPDRRGRPDRAGPRPVAGEGRDAVPPDRQELRPRAGVPGDGRPGPDPRVLSPARHRRRGGRRRVPARPPPPPQPVAGARRRPARGRRQRHQPVPVRPQPPPGRPRAAADRAAPGGRPRRRVGHRADRVHAAGRRRAATLRTPGGEETWAGAYLCGCDGAHSAVRHGLGVGFPGGTYDQPFYVADAEAEGPWSDRDFTAYVAERTFCLAFPVRERGMFRFIGVVPEALRDRDDLRFDDLRGEVEQVTGTRVTKVNWFSAYRVHHRVADRFRRGRVFLAGDAGHVHSPAGGQGMNTGIGDAVNLAWKLAAVLGGRADAVLLDSYEAERIPFARSLVRDDRPGVRGRRRPWAVLPAGPVRLRPVRPAARAAVRGRPPGPVPARLPDPDRVPGEPAERRVGGRGPRRRPAAVGRGRRQLRPARDRSAGRSTSTARRPPRLREFAAGVELPLHEWPWTPAARRAGLERDATLPGAPGRPRRVRPSGAGRRGVAGVPGPIRDRRPLIRGGGEVTGKGLPPARRPSPQTRRGASSGRGRRSSRAAC